MTMQDTSARAEHAGITDTPERRRLRSRMIRALLAGGLVLGVGAAVTLAAWNDSAFTTGSFSAGAFKLEGTVDDTTWAEYDSAPGGTLAFSMPAAGLSPGDSVSAPFAVRLSAGSTADGTVEVSTDSTSGTITDLTYSMAIKDAWGCGSGTVSTPISNAALGTGTASFSVTAGTPTSDPGDAVYVCFTITAGAGLVQSQSGSATWKFFATSS
jgi:predicted ribosomally synthesized peptide with SipW-like signal peptide